jgi:hypothetical protein
MHGCFESQYVLPILTWYLASGQAVQAAAFDTLENVLTGQSAHLEELELVKSASYVPGLHGCFESQNGWPSLSWYFPTGQSLQLGEFAAPEYVPTPQGAQMRFDVAPPSVSTWVPAAHEAWSTQ